MGANNTMIKNVHSMPRRWACVFAMLMGLAAPGCDDTPRDPEDGVDDAVDGDDAEFRLTALQCLQGGGFCDASNSCVILDPYGEPSGSLGTCGGEGGGGGGGGGGGSGGDGACLSVNCGSCTVKAGCGWNGSSCVPGTANGPTQGGGNTWLFASDQCPGSPLPSQPTCDACRNAGGTWVAVAYDSAGRTRHCHGAIAGSPQINGMPEPKGPAMRDNNACTSDAACEPFDGECEMCVSAAVAGGCIYRYGNAKCISKARAPSLPSTVYADQLAECN